jgi:hypothetical protein
MCNMKYDVIRSYWPAPIYDTATLNLDFTTGTLDSRLTFTRASTVATYINSSGYVTTAGTNVPRFDYDPVTLAPRGLLIEGQAVNSALYSQNINPNASPQNIYWVVSGAGASVTPVSQTDPANGSTASRCVLGTSAVGRVYQAFSTASGSTYTMSFWARSVSGNTSLHFWHYNSATSNYTPVTVGTSWARYQVTILARSGGGFVEFGIANLTTSAASIDLWGLQIELGSGASSYIPTTASAVTRNKDSMTLSDLSSLGISNTAGTLFVDFTNSTENSNYAANLAFRSAAGSTYGARFRWGSNALLTTYFQSNGSTGFTTNLNGSRTSFARCEAATSYSYDGTTTSVFGSINGAAMSTTSTTTQAGSIAIPTSLRWNDDGSTPSATDYSSLVMRSVKYYPTRLTIAEMNTLTAL